MKKNELDVERIHNLYFENQKSVLEIADIIGIGRHPIEDLFKEMGWKKRNNKEALDGKFVGDKNPNWKGGVDWYGNWRKQIPHFWKKKLLWKAQVNDRDDYSCVMCKSEKDIEVHHIIPVRKIIEQKDLFDIKNGVTLCHKCHMKIHMHEDEYEESFKQITSLSS